MKERLNRISEYLNGVNWGNFFSGMGQILLIVIFILTVVGNGCAGDYENPWP
jgi:hypothetical protein